MENGVFQKFFSQMPHDGSWEIISFTLEDNQKKMNKQYKTVDNSYKLLYTVYVDSDIYHF